MAKRECKASSVFEIHSVTHCIINLKKNHLIISADTEKAFNKIQYWFMIKKKTLNKLDTGRIFFALIKGIVQKPIVNIIINGERLHSFSLILRKSSFPLQPPLLNIHT